MWVRGLRVEVLRFKDPGPFAEKVSAAGSSQLYIYIYMYVCLYVCLDIYIYIYIYYIQYINMNILNCLHNIETRVPM